MIFYLDLPIANLMTMSRKKIVILSLMLVVIGVAGRFFPHLWNATPIVAIALFAGVYMGARYAIILPLAVMLITDFFIGFYQFEVMLAVYGSFALIGLIGYLISKIKSSPVIILSSMVSAILFYFVTNWAVWQFSPLYQKTLAGLLTSYTLAIPFFRNMFFGDLVYTALLFGAYEVVVLRNYQFVNKGYYILFGSPARIERYVRAGRLGNKKVFDILFHSLYVANKKLLKLKIS